MRTSCNGCRVLRKGCSDDCTIRPCLQWIKNPQSQANATVFLAKFYGRAGLINLINTGPDHLRPAIFRSLLYEACGRIANPVHGSVGLLWSGNWQLCQAAVEAVLKGTPIARAPITNEAAVTSEGPPLKAYDIRHVSKDEKSAASNDLHRPKTSCKFKRSGTKSKPSRASRPQPKLTSKAEPNRSTSHQSSLSHQSELGANLEGDSKEVESMVSEERADPSQLFRAESESVPEQGEEVRGSTGIGLELTLGLEPVVKAPDVVPVKKRRFEEFSSTESETGGSASEMELGF